MNALSRLLGSVLALLGSSVSFATTQVELTPAVLDPTFSPGAGPNDTVCAVVVGSEEEIWIGGRFTEVDGQGRNGIARLAPHGAVDPGFVSPLGPADEVHAIATLPGSQGIVVSVYTADSRPGIVFIPADGSTSQRIDFDPGIVIQSYITASSIVVLGDGETVVTADDDGLVFFQPNGTGGYIQKRVTATVAWPSFDRAIASLSLDGLGRPIAAGGFNRIAGVDQFYFARLLPNGDLDPSFTPEIPPYKTSWAGSFLYFWGASALSDGSLVGALQDMTVRLTPRGKVDGDFARFSLPDLGSSRTPNVIRNPRVVPLPNQYALLYSATAQPGSGEAGSHMYRVRPDGTIASSWNVPYSPSPGGAIQDVAADRRGNIIMVGGFTNVLGRPLRGVARLHGGATDAPPAIPALPARIEIREGTDLVLTNHPTSFADPFTAQWFSGDQLLPDQTNSRLTLRGVRSRHAGPYSLQVSNAFGATRTPPADVHVLPYPVERGRVDLDFERPLVSKILPAVVARQSDGKWLVAGKWSSEDIIRIYNVGPHTLRRLLPDGSLDGEFHPDFLDEKRTNSVITALAVQADGRILVGGSLNLKSKEGIGFLVRLLPDGSVDSGFATDPSLMTLTSELTPRLILPRITGIAIQPTGRILCSGTFRSEVSEAAIAFQTNGAVDREFTRGIPLGTSSAVVALHDGRSMLIGNFNPPLNVRTLPIRLQADGSLDGSFQPPPMEGYEKWDRIVNADESGGCVMASHDWQVRRTRVRQLDATGAVVATWGEISGAGHFEGPPMHALPGNRAVAAWVDEAQPARPLVLAVLGPRDADRWQVTRTLTTAAPFTPPQSSAFLLGADPEGRVLIGGIFGELDGIPRPGLARLHVDANTPIPAAPTLRRPSRISERFEVEIATEGNKAYQLQRTSSLVGGPWITVHRVTGNGAPRMLIDPAATEGAAFYRVFRE